MSTVLGVNPREKVYYDKNVDVHPVKSGNSYENIPDQGAAQP
jgi:hypothetical protein